MTKSTNTARHDIEHVCPACEANRTGLWATIDVLAKHDTDEVTPAIYAEIVTLSEARGSAEGMRDAA